MKSLPDLNKLQIFREVVHSGSFSKAAAKLKQPKSRISRHMAELEKDLGLQLIYRTTRQFQLTQAGKDLFQRAAPLLHELDHAVEELTSEADEISGLIKLTVPEDIGTELIGKLCFEFMNMYPKIQFELHSSNQMVDLVRESIDVAVRVGKAKDSTMIQRKIGFVGLILVASPDFLHRHSNLQKLEDLEKAPYLQFHASSSRQGQLRLSNGKETRTLKVQSKFSSNNFFSLRSLALSGAGVACIPAFLANEFITRGELVQLFKEWTTEGSPVRILIPHQKEAPLRIRKFVEFLAPRLSQFL